MIRGFQVSRMLRRMADHSIAEQLPDHGETRIEALAAACSAHHCCAHCARCMRCMRCPRCPRCLRWLRSASCASRQPALSVLLSAARRCRCCCTPMRLRPAARAPTAPGSWGAWNELDAALTGEVPRRRAWNTGRFGQLREHPTKAVTSTCSWARIILAATLRSPPRAASRARR